MEITPFIPGGAPSVMPQRGGQTRSSAPVTPPDVNASPPLTLPKPVEVDAGDVENKRYETVVKAAKTLANIYVVSDKTFTIFKDATGQYVTRFTNLRDGKVTYVPEPELVRQLEQASHEAVRALAINV